MSLSLGGISVRNPFSDYVALVLGKGDIRSMFCLIVFSIVVLVLAYLTNPSENSFRAYLTEQSFRQHLSRLDDTADDNLSSNRLRLHSSSARNSTASTAPLFAVDNNTPFHFANRASISLRTPKHVFHSFAVFTIAAMVPLSKTSEREPRDGWMISDSWYIGAFGKWWRGGVFEEWYQDVIARSKDEESWSSGILSMKRLDMLQDYHAPTFSAKNLLLRGSPPRLRNRERPALRNSTIHPRSSTPPPLPKSASLPMHTVRKVASNGRNSDSSSQIQQQQPHAQPSMSSDGARRISIAPSRSSSVLFEHSPFIAEVLHQISASKASVVDLRTQLSECQSTASQSRAILQHEVDAHRDRKRQEDVSKVELKSRTKVLEDSKRSAEGLKKDADKKLKAVQSIRDGAAQRMEFLDSEVLGLQKALSDDREFISNHRNVISDVERDITEALEQKRLEIKAAEDSVYLLNQRSRELEDKLATEKERLKVLRDKTYSIKQQRVEVFDSYQQLYHQSEEVWIQHPESQSPILQTGEQWDFASGHQPTSLIYDPRILQDDRYSNTLLDKYGSNYNGNSFATVTDSPYGHNEGIPTHAYSAQDFGSPGLATEGSMISRSFQSDNDPYVDKEWRHNSAYSSHYTDTDSCVNSPTSPQGPSFSSPESASEDVHFSSARGYEHRLESPLQLQRSTWKHAKDVDPITMDKSASRTWFSNIGRSGKGLNPDAKEFNLLRRNNLFCSHLNGRSTMSSYDALNPTGLGPANSTPTSSTNQSLLRAFAPSPAEREVLQRALGGSTNTSFERLPSLSDVGSIPASPTNAHAHLSPPTLGRDLGRILPAWLQSLPRGRKVNFSPWDDDEEEPAQSSKEISARRR